MQAAYSTSRISDKSLVPEHVNRIEAYLLALGDTLEDKEAFTSRLEECIAAGSAYMCTNNGVVEAFLYANKVDGKLYGAALWGVAGGVMSSMKVFELLWLDNPSSNTLRVIPHGNNLKNFLSFASTYSLRAYNSGIVPYITLPFNSMVSKVTMMNKYLNKVS